MFIFDYDLHRLKNEWKSDPIITTKAKKYMNGPKRHAWKNLHYLKGQYRREYYSWFLIGAVMTWPLAIIVGRRCQRW